MNLHLEKKKEILNLLPQVFPILIFIGMLVVTKVEPTALGGTIDVLSQCNRREIHSLAFQGSPLVERSKRTVAGLACGILTQGTLLCQRRENPEAKQVF